MIGTITRRGAGQAYETIVHEDGRGVVYGRGVTPENSLRSAIARLELLKMEVLENLQAFDGWESALHLAYRLRLNSLVISSVLFLLAVDGDVIHNDCPARGLVYRVPIPAQKKLGQAGYEK